MREAERGGCLEAVEENGHGGRVGSCATHLFIPGILLTSQHPPRVTWYHLCCTDKETEVWLNRFAQDRKTSNLNLAFFRSLCCRCCLRHPLVPRGKGGTKERGLVPAKPGAVIYLPVICLYLGLPSAPVAAKCSPEGVLMTCSPGMLRASASSTQ